MANTYSQLYVHLVFAVGNHRDNAISPLWRDKLYAYIGGIIKGRGHKLMAIGGMEDHVHLFVSMLPKDSVSDLVQIVKIQSTKWVHGEGLTKSVFKWQSGFGAFTYSKSQVPNVVRYIQHQQEHHRGSTFIEEYRMMLDKFEVSYDENYLFKPLT
ncbi:MAG: IS200/IS605 family transposase [Muribaculaceae bacterium]|nr:IS200/IS605 family transposase [Muribaculaceae bacterium]